MEYNPPRPTPELNQFWGSACPCAQEWTHINDTAFILCPDLYIKKKKKKGSAYRPSQFSGQKGKQTLHFFRPNNYIQIQSFSHKDNYK